MPRSRDTGIPPTYRRLLHGVLSFKDLADAELCLARLENLRQRFLSASDKEGVDACRLVALRGRRRAEMVGRNPRVGLRKRKEKKEIALWFRIWLETPEIFPEWLALRKHNEEFRRSFPEGKT